MDTPAVRNQNPGNLRDPATGNFQTFSDPVEGKAALYNDLTAKMTGQSKTGLNGSSSLLDFAKTYAPASDKNDPIQYAADLANKLKVSPDTQIGTLIPRIDDFASAISSNEDPSATYQQASNIKTTPDTSARKTFKESISQNNTIPIEQHGPGLAGIGGGLVSGFIKPFAEAGTNLVNAGQIAMGLPETKPFSGKFLGDVQGLGKIDITKSPLNKENLKTIKKSVGTGTEIGLDLATPTITKGILGKYKAVKALTNPEIDTILREGSNLLPHEATNTLTKETAKDILINKLKDLTISESGGTTEKLILKALKELTPTLSEQQSLISRITKGGFNLARNAALAKIFGNTVAGLINKK